MRWELDLQADALYVYLADDRTPVRQVELDDGMIADVDEKGDLVGVEVLGVTSPFSFDSVVAAFDLDEGAIQSLEYVSSALRMRQSGLGAFEPARISEPARIPSFV